MATTTLQNNYLTLKTDNLLVSVIIPTHKSNMEYFLRCFNSVKKQTFGFENIEVIIVAHNTDEHYYKQLEHVVKNYSNVRLLKLKNDKSSASSPRNYGMKFVNGKYITFLDDDDALKENFIKDSLNYISTNDVEFISYARKNVRDDRNIVSIKYNELESKIGKETVYNIQSGAKCIPFEQAVFVTGKLFNFDIIKRNHISFNEDIPVFEDFLFVSEVIKHSKSVCVQPHILGYYYHLNQDSMINNLNRSDEDILRCVMGILKVIDSIKSSQYLSKIELRELVAYIGVTMFSSINVLYSTRCTVKDLIKKHIKLLWAFDSTNIYAKKRNTMNYKIMETELMHPLLAFLFAKSLNLLKINPVKLVSYFTKKFD